MEKFRHFSELNGLSGSSLVHKIFEIMLTTGSKLVHDFFTNCSWIVHDYFMPFCDLLKTCSTPLIITCSNLVYNLFTTCQWIVEHFFMILYEEPSLQKRISQKAEKAILLTPLGWFEPSWIWEKLELWWVLGAPLKRKI